MVVLLDISTIGRHCAVCCSHFGYCKESRKKRREKRKKEKEEKKLRKMKKKWEKYVTDEVSPEDISYEQYIQDPEDGHRDKVFTMETAL